MLYSKDSLELLFKTVGADRCLFGTERPGVGTVKDPKTGRWLDETRHLIEGFDWLSAAEKKMIFEDNAKKIFKLDVQPTSTAGKERMHEFRESELGLHGCCWPRRLRRASGTAGRSAKDHH